MKPLVMVLAGVTIGLLLASLLLQAGCAGQRPTMAPVARAHWANMQWDGAHRRMTATAVNSSTVPVVLDCTDLRVVIPPRTEVDVMILEGQSCDLQPEEMVPAR